MLSILDITENPRGARLSRRQWLRIGGSSLAGLSLAHGARAATSASAKNPAGSESVFGKAKSVIVIFLSGGPPQHETWDPKPDAPAEVRGDFGTIATRTPGLSIGELMPLTSHLTNHIAVLRGVVTNDNAHSSSGYQMMTGVPHIPPNVENAVSKAPNLAPHWGAIMNYVRQSDRTSLRPAMALPNRIANAGEIVWPGQSGGVLGPRFDPWLLTCDPSAPGFTVPDLALPSELPPLRFERRLSLRDQLDSHLDRWSDSAAVAGFTRRSQQALGLLQAERTRRAFDLSLEPDAVRDRYGRSRWAQSILLSRRLVEAGNAFVQINWCNTDGEPNSGSWDTHEKHSDLLKRLLMPRMDRAYSALLTDLAERGLLDETLVVWAGEFGHTPRMNANAGRDHWGQCFSIALAGAGVRGGIVHGKSDGHAAYPVAGLVEPRDLMATLFHLVGAAPDTELRDIEGRPIPISRGRVIEEIL